MTRIMISCLLFSLSLPVAYAQRDAPVWESYLASISIYHEDDWHLGIDLIFRKDGGPHEHTEHQMYLIAYLEKDEDTILKLASDALLLDKTQPSKKMLLDVLREKRLITVLDSKVARRTAYPPGAFYGKADLSAGAFPFHFSLSFEDLFEAINRLKNFDSENVTDSSGVYFEDRFKLLVFVPVNDSKYADKVSAAIRGRGDFANWSAKLAHPRGEWFASKTILLYFRPLPYAFHFRKTSDSPVEVFVN